MSPKQTLEVVFFKTPGGSEPARDWLRGLDEPTRKQIGGEIRYVQENWPVGPPRVGVLAEGVWEVRVTRPGRNQYRTYFAVADGTMYLLHGIVKKTETTPKADKDLAIARKRTLLPGGRGRGG